MKKFGIIKRIVIYLLGLLIIALGINISKMSGLGISPVSSIPGVLAGIFPDFSLGNMVIIVYCLLVVAQLAVLQKNFKWQNILGVPVALVFGLMVDCLGTETYRLKLAGIDLGIKKEFTGILAAFPRPENLGLRFVYLLISMVIIGIGVAIYLQPKLVPMPAEGLAVAISQKWGKAFGNCKTGVDFSLIFIAAVLQMLFLGGISTLGKGVFTQQGVVGIGTVLSALCVGQIVKLIHRIPFKQS